MVADSLHWELSAYLIQRLIDLGAVVVTGIGNDNLSPNGYPARFGNPLDAHHIPDLIVVGSSENDGLKPGATRPDAWWVTCYAPGEYVRLPDTEAGDHAYTQTFGSSFCEYTSLQCALVTRL